MFCHECNEISTLTFTNRWGVNQLLIYRPSINPNNKTVIFSHGYTACSEWYSWLYNLLVDQGYLVAAVTVPNRTSTNISVD